MKTMYELPAPGKCYDEWRAYQSPAFEPNARQLLVMAAVARAIDAGLFYNSDLNEAVAAALGVTPEQLARNTDKVSGGDFAYDVYYARSAVQARRAHEKLCETAATLSLKPGDKAGALIFNDGKRTTGVVIREAGAEGRELVVEGKRGGKPVGLRCNVSALANAIQTAWERKARPDTYEDFKLARMRQNASPLAAKVAARLANFESNELGEAEILSALTRPEAMPQQAFMALQTLMESMESDVAIGQDCLAGFDALHDEVARLMNVSPWTLHPDHGCVLAAAVEELDRAAAPAPH